MREQMLIGVMTGKSQRQMAQEITERFGVGASNARRLVRTEAAFVSGEVQARAYEECGADKYEFVATLDTRTSKICQELDGKVFETKDRQVGVNYPPMHPYCRSTTIIHLDDETMDELESRRIARNPETGLNEYVPGDTTYPEWAAENEVLNRNAAEDRIVNGLSSGKRSGVSINDYSNGDRTESGIRTAKEARRVLSDEVGFSTVGHSVDSIDDELLIASTEQLRNLENRFGMIHEAGMKMVARNHTSGTMGFVLTDYTNPLNETLSLCPASFSDHGAYIAELREMANRNQIMPCALTDEELSRYIVTHEYGHMILNHTVAQEYENRGWSETVRGLFVNRFSQDPDVRYAWYISARNECINRVQDEIMALARWLDPEADINAALSQNAMRGPSEFFAEAFANSQLSAPNVLGRACDMWLQIHGW